MTPGELFENAINHWRDAKGIGTALIPTFLNDKVMLLGVLQRIYSRSPTCKTVIITSNFTERSDITEFITTQENNEENNEEFKRLIKEGNIKIFTIDYINRCKFYNYPFLVIFYHLNSLSESVINYLTNSKFNLVIINKLFTDNNDMVTLYKKAPLLQDFKQNELDEVRLSTPIEETWVGIDIPKDSEEYKLLNYYNEYISTSISIFGSFEIMNQANVGNIQLNISSMQICSKIAQENGWNEHLDMNIEFNIELDKLYNPMNLKERASQTYEIIRKRSQLLSDYEGKLDLIFEIIKDNPDKKILIINKRGEFANKVTDYVNNLSESVICGNYHDKINNIPAIDLEGNPIYYKTGKHKGERKTMGAKAQKTFNVNKFNLNDINVLSTNNAPDKDLNIDVDIVIITSPMCENIKSYMYRLSNLFFRNMSLNLYSLYVKGSMEQRLLERKELANNHNVKNANNDEIFSDFIIID